MQHDMEQSDSTIENHSRAVAEVNGRELAQHAQSWIVTVHFVTGFSHKKTSVRRQIKRMNLLKIYIL